MFKLGSTQLHPKDLPLTVQILAIEFLSSVFVALIVLFGEINIKLEEAPLLESANSLALVLTLLNEILPLLTFLNIRFRH